MRFLRAILSDYSEIIRFLCSKAYKEVATINSMELIEEDENYVVVRMPRSQYEQLLDIEGT